MIDFASPLTYSRIPPGDYCRENTVSPIKMSRSRGAAPSGVDRGVKEPSLIRAFLAAARTAELA
jgi:hypothetical protein